MCTNAEREKIRADVFERNAAATVAATCKQVKRRFTYNIKQELTRDIGECRGVAGHGSKRGPPKGRADF